jgi:hypothetical protein
VFVGAVAAFASWALYGPMSGTTLPGLHEGVDMRSTALGGALLVGVLGARWLSSEADRSIFRAAAYEAVEQRAQPPETADNLSALETLAYISRG